MASTVDIDDDTLQAVLGAWAFDSAGLAALFLHPPRTGRLKSPDVLPYAHVASEFIRRQQYTKGQLDRRKVTITLRGLKADATKGLALVLARFNTNMARPGLGVPGLTYPSAANFVCWRPINNGLLKQDEIVKEGQDVWIGTVEGEVSSFRNP